MLMLSVRADLLVEALGKVGRAPKVKVPAVPGVRDKADQKGARLAGPVRKPEDPAKVFLRGALLVAREAREAREARVVVALRHHRPRHNVTVIQKPCDRGLFRDRYA